MTLSLTGSYSANTRNWGFIAETISPVLNQLSGSFKIHSPSVTTSLSSWRENNSSEHLIKLLEQIYFIRDYSEVTTFLRKNPKLITLLFEAYLASQKYFTGKYHLELAMENNTFEADSPKLFLQIISYSDPETAYKCLDNFDENWWVKNAHKSNYKMNIDLEFGEDV
jgi:hypothetical protein